jgi:hypothetical protein
VTTIWSSGGGGLEVEVERDRLTGDDADRHPRIVRPIRVAGAPAGALMMV